VQIECAQVSLAGNRQENQDRIAVLRSDSSALIVAVDGMGGHAEGARAAEVTVATLRECFEASRHPILDPQGFLTLALARAHDRVVALGPDVTIDHKPRATCAVALIQDGSCFWAHVGDSRVYQVRAGAVHARTRDHSHVELLLREGLIRESEMKGHPMRNYVECCLGGDRSLPDMSIEGHRGLATGDLVLVCTDGLWSGVDDREVAALGEVPPDGLDAALARLAERAVTRNVPHSDNTSAAALRWLAD
jgi:PPM family protein phosphatase